MQILQLYYAFSSRGKGGSWGAMGTQSVGSFFGFRRGPSCAIRAISAGIGLIDLILSDLGQARSLVRLVVAFLYAPLCQAPSFGELAVSEKASKHQEEDRRRRDCGVPTVEDN